MGKEKIEVLSTEKRTFPPSKEFSKKAWIKSIKDYEAIYKRSVEQPEKFWGEMAEQNLTWYKKWDKVLDYDFHKPYIKWFTGGKLNVSVNCLDRYINTPTRNKAAIIWEADGGEYKTYTYQQLYTEVNKFANVLKKKGIKKGDRVTIYLPDDPRAPDLDACLRPHRRDPQHRVRRVFRQVADGPHPGLRVHACSSPRTKACAAAASWRMKANADEALERVPQGQERSSSCSTPTARRPPWSRTGTPGGTRK